LTALGSWLLARHHGGKWLIRIEDLDPPREAAGAADAQLRTLAAFGLVSDLPVIRQSQRSEHYRERLEYLLAKGAAFFCRCSRSELASHGGIHHHCFPAREQRPAAIRLHVPDEEVIWEDQLQGALRQNVAAEVGDFVLKRADGYWAYQFAVVVDDADQGVTDIVRGMDLLDSTPRQILLHRALGLSPPRYLHLPLLLDDHGHKFSKSSGAPPLDPDEPLTALRSAWRLLGQEPSALHTADSVDQTLHCAMTHFQIQRLPRTSRHIG
jgi:glutamyl-Q tRNA(Asp) synthetase